MRFVRFGTFVLGWLAAAPAMAQGPPIPDGPEFQVNTYTTGLQFGAQVASGSAGSFVVVWESLGQDGSDYGVFGQRFDASALPAGPEFRANTYTPHAQFLQDVAAGSAGDFVVVWVDQYLDGSSYGVFGQRFDSGGTALGSQFQVNTYTPFGQGYIGTSVAVAPGGDFLVTWADDHLDGHGRGIFAQRFDSSGVPQGLQFRVNTTTTFDEDLPRVAADGNGNYIVVWISTVETPVCCGTGLDGDKAGIVGQRFDGSGAPLGAEFVVNSNTTGNQLFGHVAADAAGNFVVVWQSSDGSGDGVFARRFDDTGAPLGPDFQVNEYTTGAQDVGGVAFDGTGRFVIGWSSAGQDGSGNGVFARRYQADGTPEGPEFQVNEYTTGSQTGAAVTADSLGRFVVAWNSAGQDGSGYGVFARRFLETSYLTTTTTSTVTTTSSMTTSSTSSSSSTSTSTSSSTSSTTSTLAPRSIAGKRLVIRASQGVTNRLVLVARDAAIDTTVGPGVNPIADGAVLQVYSNNGSGDSACLPLPASGWTARGDAGHPTFTYADRSSASGPCRMALVTSGRLKVVCRAGVAPIPYSLDEPAQVSVAARVRSGSMEYCAVFGGTVARDQSGVAFVARDAGPPPSCPTPPASCP